MTATTTVEFASSPLAIDTKTPRFSWTVPLRGRCRHQTAYRILVATSEEILTTDQGDAWDSGKVPSSQSTLISYNGTPLISNRDYFWKVELWDEAGQPTGFSSSARFGTAFYNDSDWKAQWIGMGPPDEPIADPDSFHPGRVTPEIKAIEPDPRAPMMRHEFTLRKTVRRARAFVCGLGLYELRLNGSKVGNEVLATSRTDFRKRVLYGTYDITPLLKLGNNAVGVMLGSGWFSGHKKYWGWQMQWYGSPRAIVQIEVEFADGSSQQVVSDGSWQGAWSPITFNCIYDGENYDARLEQEGWDQPDFKTPQWQPVNLVAAPGGKLVPATHESEQVTETLRPVSMSEPKPGVYIYDLGRNIAGWARLKIRNGEPGQLIKLRFAEALDTEGMLNGTSHAAARHADYYIQKGASEEIYEPRFTYHGFRFVELTGYPGTPDLETLAGRFAHVAVAQTGSFECSSALINNIHRCTVQSQLCNIQMGVPTDDTQRPERLGWGADAWGSAHEAMYNLWMPRVYTKWIRDFQDQQTADGVVGMITPRAGIEEDLVWSAAFLMVPLWQYIHYGDRRILEENYPRLQHYLQYLEATGRNQITQSPLGRGDHNKLPWTPVASRFSTPENKGFLQTSQWGDHLSTAEGFFLRSDLPLSIATAFYFLDASMLAHIAEILGKSEDTIRYRDLAGKIKAAFNARFYEPELGIYDHGIQSAQAWALAFDLVPGENRKKVADYLYENIALTLRRLTTGYVGTKYAIQVLTETGHPDLVWRLANATDYPSWGYMLSKNQTTTAERWDGEEGSLNHVALGAAIDEWFYSTLAGIRPDPASPGFAHIIFKPYLPQDLTWARASIQTERGCIVSSWRQDGTSAWLRIVVPANSKATVHIPAKSLEMVTEGGIPAANAEGVTFLRAENGETVLETGSGIYLFAFPVATFVK